MKASVSPLPERWRRANVRNVSFYFLYGDQLIYLINSVDKSQKFSVSLPHRRSTAVSSTSSPGPSPCSKWRRIGEIPGQGCWNTRGVLCHVTHDEMKWLFRRLFPTSDGPVCLLQSDTVVQTKRRHFVVFTSQNSKEFGSLGQGFLRSASILTEEKPLETRLQFL